MAGKRRLIAARQGEGGQLFASSITERRKKRLDPYHWAAQNTGFVSVLHAQRGVPDDLYARAIALLGQDGVIDLVGIAGYYTLVSMTLNVFDVRPPEGEPVELG